MKKNFNQRNRQRVKDEVREQPRKDSKRKRVNYDNTRESKFFKDIDSSYAERMHAKKTSGSNDLTWYAHNPELLKAAASLPFSVTTGQKTPFGPIPVGSTAKIDGVPGVMALSWVPSLGGEASDAVNQAARSTYSFLVHANSRTSTKYTDQDLMLVIMSAGILFSMIAHGIRMYGLMKTFDQRNDYLPKSIIDAMGFNYDDCRKNLSRIWFDLNEIIARSQQIWIPNTFPLINRWWWMNSHIYIDAESIKAQYYMFVPARFGMYSELYDDQGGAIDFQIKVPLSENPAATPSFYNYNAAMENGGRYTWSRYMDFLNAAMSYLVDSEDRGMMMGDILKAYGADKIFAIQPIPVDYRVQPVYDREVLTQIENAAIVNVPPVAFVQDQETMRIKTSWFFASGDRSQWLSDVQVLNFHQLEVPTPEQIMVATRLKPAGNVIRYQTEGTKFAGVYPAFTGTEYLTAAYLCVNGVSGDTPKKLMFNLNNILAGYYNTNSAGSSINIMLLGQWMAFDWAPWIYVAEGYNNPAPTTGQELNDNFEYKFVTALGDYDQYTYIDPQTLRKMHTTAVYSEFGVPTI